MSLGQSQLRIWAGFVTHGPCVLQAPRASSPSSDVASPKPETMKAVGLPHSEVCGHELGVTAHPRT